MANISIFGLGYVGCISIGCLAANGHQVVGVDVSQVKVDFINTGKSTIIEREIDRLICKHHEQGKVSATTHGIQAVIDTDVSFICVGTPSSTNGHLNLQSIYNVADEIGKGIREKDRFHVIVIRSTVMPGTNAQVTEIIENASGKKNHTGFAVISNPEFLREGSAVWDYYHPAYTLIGSDDKPAVEIIKDIYRDINAPMIITEIKIAELLKYVNNAFHALKICFANEIGNICYKLGIDGHKLMDIFCTDTKLNLSPCYLKPGFSYGGSCLPKDLKAIKTIAHDFYLECPVMENIEKSNELQKRNVYEKILEFEKNRLGFLGLSFKPGTDDLRESPIIDIIEQLLGKGFDVKIYDKNVRLSQLVGANRDYIFKKIPYLSRFILDSPEEIINTSEVVIVVNKEAEFSDILNRMPKDKMIYDLVNIDFENKKNRSNYIGIAW